MESSAPVDMEQTVNSQGETCRPQSSIPRPESYPFLNHSSTTLPNNLPPSVDDKPLARQKRKRTSPEDQAILEAAYNRDGKPDKAARLELVKQVALGEKEVQIWFQNRRQTSRRKSRPLLPHEIAQYQLARNGFSYLPLELDADSTAEDGTLSAAPISNYPESGSFDRRDDTNSSPALSQSYSTDDSMVSSRTSSQMVIASDSAPLSVDGCAAVGYLANRRSTLSLRSDASIRGHKLSWSGPAQSTLPKRSSSQVRLSLTGDGKAQIVTKDGTSPSPQKPQQPTPADLYENDMESQAASRDHVPVPSNPESRSLHRSSSARARDSRTWEFWCDKEARNELGSKAEKDASGSAADAIDLLRSTSGRRILGALSSRNNNGLPRHTPFLQSKNLGAKPPRLHKSNTSLGRLQSGAKSAGTALAYPSSTYQVSGDVRIPGNDSDKENWSPWSLQRSESSGDGRHASVDKDSLSKDSKMHRDGKLSGNPDAVRKAYALNEYRRDGGVETDPELAAFMRGQRKDNKFSEAEDMDCIQGLLSLSQGNWR